MKVIHLVVIGIVGLFAYHVGFQLGCSNLFEYCFRNIEQTDCGVAFSDSWDYDIMRDTVNPFIKSWYECEGVYFN